MWIITQIINNIADIVAGKKNRVQVGGYTGNQNVRNPFISIQPHFDFTIPFLLTAALYLYLKHYKKYKK